MEVINKKMLQNMTVSDLLAVPFDQIETAIGFVLPPVGAYVLLVQNAEIVTVGKDANAKEAIEFTFVVQATVELVDPTATPVEDGAEFTITYIGGTGVSYYKRDFLEVNQALSPENLTDALEKIKNCTVTAIIKHRSDLRDPQNPKYYPQLDTVQLAA